MTLNIAVNASSLLVPLTGIGYYVKQLLVHMAGLGVDMELFYGLRWDRQIRNTPLPSAGRIIKVKRALFTRVPGSYDLMRSMQQRAFDRGVRATRPVLYHDPNFLPFRFEGPTVITVPDISWVRYPETHPVDRRRVMDRFFPAALERADRIIAISEFVRQELVDVFGVAADKIAVTPLGVDPGFRPRSRDELLPVLARYGLQPGRYLLTVGTLEPRKNLGLTLRAYAALPQELRKRYPLAVVGMSGWREEQFTDQLQRLRAAGEVVLTGYVPAADLPFLYAGAHVFAYPSLYEGFGLPPLEAMASGVPTIVSDRASLPEVGGDAVIQVPADDLVPLAEAMRRLIEEEAFRGAYARRGLQRAARFTWQQCAQRTLGVYRTLFQ